MRRHAWVIECEVESEWEPCGIRSIREHAREKARGLRLDGQETRVRKWIPANLPPERKVEQLNLFGGPEE